MLKRTSFVYFQSIELLTTHFDFETCNCFQWRNVTSGGHGKKVSPSSYLQTLTLEACVTCLSPIFHAHMPELAGTSRLIKNFAPAHTIYTI